MKVIFKKIIGWTILSVVGLVLTILCWPIVPVLIGIMAVMALILFAIKLVGAEE